MINVVMAIWHDRGIIRWIGTVPPNHALADAVLAELLKSCFRCHVEIAAGDVFYF